MATGTGTLTDGDVLELKRLLAADPACAAGMPQLTDIRGVTDFQVTSDGVRRMVAHDAKESSALADSRLAIVAGEEAAFGMARMYQTLTESVRPHVCIFRDYAAAARWLGVEASPPQS